jgi:probable F420-dependent oxidoreductase
MSEQRPFRFGAFGNFGASRAEWLAHAQKVEAMGYSTLVVGDHPAMGGGPIAALMAAADATTSLRVGSHVFANGLRSPLLLAQEAAVLDLLSDGRLEFGIGGGWYLGDFQACGIPFDPPVDRIRRLEEAVVLFKRLFSEDSVTHQGDYYQIQNFTMKPKPKQQPHPPFFIGGGGRRVLTLAAQHADIVGVDPKGTVQGTKDLATTSADAAAQQLAWIRQAAGTRFDELEIHMLIFAVIVTDSRRQEAEKLAAQIESMPATLASNRRMSVDDILASPRFLIGTVEQICTDLQERRARYGISYNTVQASDVDAFGPIVAQLAGQ